MSVFHDVEARAKVLEGAETLYRAVKTTLGPKGRNVVIGSDKPVITHDGVTVAKAVNIKQKGKNLGVKTGAELIKEAASKMNDVAGDGTTTVTVLTYHILNEANKLIAAGYNPMQLRKELEEASEEVLAKLLEKAEKVDDKLANVAILSAGDPEIGKLVASVFDRVGKDGNISIEESQGLKLESEVVDGYLIKSGFVSSYMASDQDKQESVLNKPYVLVTNEKIGSFQEVLPILEKIIETGTKELLIVAEDVVGDALANLVLNKVKGIFNAVAVRLPFKTSLDDVAAVTGATTITKEQGLNFSNATLGHIGKAEKVIVTTNTTTIIEGGGNVKAYAKTLEEQLKGAVDYEQAVLKERIATVEGKVAVIKVGGATETEIEEKKFRVEDAVAASRAALAEGTIPGGGVVLVHLSKDLRADTTGAEVLKRALVKPFRVLMKNSGLNPDEWLPKVRQAEFGYGIDVNGGEELVNLREVGIIDPVLVTRQAIQNAVSIAGTAMTMGALIVDDDE